jgi:hypothetical protein
MGTGSAISVPCVLTAEVSIVIVGARLRPSEGVLGALPSAMLVVRSLVCLVAVGRSLEDDRGCVLMQAMGSKQYWSEMFR